MAHSSSATLVDSYILDLLLDYSCYNSYYLVVHDALISYYYHDAYSYS